MLFLLQLAVSVLTGGLPWSFPGETQAQTAPVAAYVETTLATANEQIRQYAFDGDPATYFASAKNPGRSDHFTLVFTQPVTVKSLQVSTGRPQGGDQLENANLEISADGSSFTTVAKFATGTAKVEIANKTVKAVRIQPTSDLTHPLVIREITLGSEPNVAVFRYPVEFVLDVADAPDMKEWIEKVARVCEQQYPMICEELRSDGYKPPRIVHMALKNSYQGVAATSGARIVGSVKYFKDRPQDIGAMVHETAHVVQRYRGRGNPGWLVEGIADYIRFFKYEPGKIGRINPDRARYNGSYRVSAAFLAYLTEKHNKEIVRKLN
jgi:hypothetical protein